MKNGYRFRWEQNFFGLGSGYKPALHEQIFDIVYHGNGFNWSDVYNMPIWLRRFYYKKLAEKLKKEQEAAKSGKAPGSDKLPRGPFGPTSSK